MAELPIWRGTREALRKSVSPVLALRPKDAAIALGIGQRKLWELTAPRGPIPCVKLGTCVLYRFADLDAWLAREAARSTVGDGATAHHAITREASGDPKTR